VLIHVLLHHFLERLAFVLISTAIANSTVVVRAPMARGRCDKEKAMDRILGEVKSETSVQPSYSVADFAITPGRELAVDLVYH